MEGVEPVFDFIADNYDSTRSELDERELEALMESLKDCTNVLEIGAGTGRIMKPLQDHGFDITGVDISRKMLQKAQEKGLKHLVMGDATNLPFLDKSFDAAITFHVFHLIDDLDLMFNEASRVSRKYIITFIREREQPKDFPAERRSNLPDIVMKIAEKYGYRIEPESAARRRPEDDIVKRFPPDKKLLVKEYARKANPEHFIERMRYSSRFTRTFSKIPEEIIEKIFDEAKSEISKMKLEPVEVKIKEYMAIWFPQEIKQK